MRILILIQCSNLGGMEQYALLLGSELKELGHKLEFLSLNDAGKLFHLLESKGIATKAVGYRGRWGWRSFFPLKRAINDCQPDSIVMVGHNLMASIAIGATCRTTRVLSLHYHHRGVNPTLVWKAVYLIASIQFRRIIFPTEFIRNEASEFLPDFSDRRLPKLVVLPYPFREQQKPSISEKTQARGTFGVSPNQLVVGNAGWLIPRKRWDIFLNVAALVGEAISDVVFLIAGDGPDRADLEARAMQLGIKNSVKFLGWKDDLNGFYESLDVLLFVSDWDALGRTPAEAMSFGVPVVASVENGGLSELINSEAVGFLTNHHDVKTIAGNVVRLLKDPEFAEGMGLRGQRRVRETGDSRRHAHAILDLLVHPEE